LHSQGGVRTAGWILVLLVFVTSGQSISAQQQAASKESASKGVDVDAEPQDEGRLKGVARKLGSLASPGDEEGVSMSAGIIVAGSGLSGGVGYRRSDVIKQLDVEVEGNLSVRLYQDYRVAIGLLESRSSTLDFDVADRRITSLFNAASEKAPGSALFLDMRFRDYPRHTYYGTGIHSRDDDRADYGLRGMSIEGVWQWQLTPTLGLSARGGSLNLDVRPGHDDAFLNIENRFALASIPGGLEQPRFLTFGAGIVHDTRHQPGAPEDGRMVGVGLRHYSAMDMSELSFTRLTLDARGYQRLLSDRGVLAVRGLLSSDFAGETGDTPFYLQQSLGGSETLRSYHSYRFPDLALAHASVEYRWRAHRYVEVAPFFDVGTVARAFSRLSLASLKMSSGVGIRARTNRRAIARLDWAWGSEGHRIVVGTGPVF
jgi:hypothetical protein